MKGKVRKPVERNEVRESGKMHGETSRGKSIKKG